jgi:hypothetical protein
MRRVIAALLIAPLIVLAPFGVGGLVIYPFVGIFGLAPAALLFLLFRRFGWLQWWHAAAVGVICGALATLSVGGSWEYLDAFGPQLALRFAGLGISISVVFWFLGIFRNAAFPSISRAIPYRMSYLLPLVMLGCILYWSIDPLTFDFGRVIHVAGKAPSRTLTVRLSGGTVVEVPLSNDSRPSNVMQNQCWHLMSYWSIRKWGPAYSLMSPFGGGINAC